MDDLTFRFTPYGPDNKSSAAIADAREIPAPIALKWAKWSLLTADLEHVRAAAKKAAELARAEMESPGSGGEERHVMAIALRSSAVVAYARCFVGSQRSMLDVGHLQLSPEDKEWHDHYIALRHRHVAHAEGVREAAVPLARLSPDGEWHTLSVLRIEVHGSVLAMEALQRLAAVAIEHANAGCEEIRKKVQAYVEAVPPRTRLTWPEATATVSVAVEGRPPQLPAKAAIAPRR